MTNTKPNAELAYKVLDHIDADPDSWEQLNWYRKTKCGTVACFAGWAVELAGAEVEIDRFGRWKTVSIDGRHYDVFAEAARVALRIESEEIPGTGGTDADGEPEDPDELFDAGNTRDDLGRFVEAIFGPRPAVKA